MKIYFIFLLLMSGLLKGSNYIWRENNTNNNLVDMSTICVDNFQKNVFLTYSMGIIDAIAIVITNRYNFRNCSIVFHEDIFDGEINRIIVIEFLSTIDNSNSICNQSIIYLTENENNVIDVCKEIAHGDYSNPFVYTSNYSLQMSIEDFNDNYFQAIKITGTATKKQIGRCDSNDEIQCYMDKKITCIGRELQCDQNINCGYNYLYDEAEHLCKKRENHRLWLISIMGTITCSFILYIIFDRIQKCIPRRKKHRTTEDVFEENTIVLTTQYLPPVKTYIPTSEAKTLNLRRPSSESTNSPQMRLHSRLFNFANKKVNLRTPLHKKRFRTKPVNVKLK